MDQFFELLPIIVIILASLGPKILESFQKNSDQEEERNAPAETEQQRRIKEEIRRRIEAARQGQQPPQTPSQQIQRRTEAARQGQQPQPAQTQQKTLTDPQQQRRSSPPPLTPTASGSPERLGRAAPSAEPVETFDPYATQKELEAAQERLKTSHRKLDQAKQKARQRQLQKSKNAFQQNQAAPTLVGLNAKNLRSTLRNKKQIRQAIVLAEVLGKPVSTRGN